MTTADQVIEKFNALTPDEKRRVHVTTLPSGAISLSDASNYKAIDWKTLKPSSRKTAGTRRKTLNKNSQKILWKNLLIRFVPNKYVLSYDEMWLLESVLGSVTLRKSLLEYRVLDADFVERLFRQAPYSFYLNQAETWLFADYGDLSEAEGGPLKQLTAVDVLQRYGLKLLEEAKEKQYVRL